MKFIGLLLTIFLSGYTFGVNAGNETTVEEAVCPSIQDKNFIKENPLPSAEKITKQKIERMDANIKFKNSIKEDLINTKFNL